MKKITMNKKAKVSAPAEFQKTGVAAFQMVEFVVSYFGNEITTMHDTKIIQNGDQFVIGGCGFIPEGFKV